MTNEYSDKNEWKKFTSDYIIPLRDSADALVEYWNYLKEEIDSVPFNEIETEKDENFKRIFLGGVKENGDYSERSLALFYNKFFGTRLSNLQEYLISQKEGVTSQVTGAVEESEFMKFVRNISGKTKAILEFAYQGGLIESSETLEIDFGEFIKEPEKVTELIEDFYNNALKITVNCNQHTLFLWTIRKITRRYQEVAYPELREEEKFEALKSFVGLEKYFVPEMEEKTENDRKVKRDYTLWHLPDNSFGGLVCGLNEIVFVYFGNESLREDLGVLFEEVKNLKEDFIKEAERSLNDVNWKFPEDYRYFFNGDSAISIKIYSGDSRGFYCVGETSIFKVLDEISPGLFFGLASLTFKYTDMQYELKAVGHTKGLYVNFGINSWW